MIFWNGMKLEHKMAIFCVVFFVLLSTVKSPESRIWWFKSTKLANGIIYSTNKYHFIVFVNENINALSQTVIETNLANEMYYSFSKWKSLRTLLGSGCHPLDGYLMSVDGVHVIWYDLVFMYFAFNRMK